MSRTSCDSAPGNRVSFGPTTGGRHGSDDRCGYAHTKTTLMYIRSGGPAVAYVDSPLGSPVRFIHAQQHSFRILFAPPQPAGGGTSKCQRCSCPAVRLIARGKVPAIHIADARLPGAPAAAVTARFPAAVPNALPDGAAAWQSPSWFHPRVGYPGWLAALELHFLKRGQLLPPPDNHVNIFRIQLQTAAHVPGQFRCY